MREIFHVTILITGFSLCNQLHLQTKSLWQLWTSKACLNFNNLHICILTVVGEVGALSLLCVPIIKDLNNIFPAHHTHVTVNTKHNSCSGQNNYYRAIFAVKSDRGGVKTKLNYRKCRSYLVDNNCQLTNCQLKLGGWCGAGCRQSNCNMRH